MKKVSVIVPVYNQEKYVPATLDHVLHQDYPDLEVIICDDASTDGTRDVLRDWLRAVETEQASFASGFHREEGRLVVERTHHPRYPGGREIRWVLNERNVGGAANCNAGFDLATGDYVTYISGDDLPHPAMLSTLAAELERAGADFAYSDMFIVDDAGRILRKFALPDFDFEKSLARWYLLGVSKLWRRGLDGRFDPSFRSAGDYELFLRFAMAGARFVHVPRVLFSVRAHGPDRKVGLHTPEMESTAMEESARLAERAREFLERRTA